jgi:DNA-binding NarL/FixJ family response regulator
MSDVIHILLVEDDPLYANLIKHSLAKAPDLGFTVESTDLLYKAIDRVALAGIDVVLLDLTLADSSGHETFSTFHAHHPDTPVLVLTSYDDEALAVEIVRSGAQDYLLKEAGLPNVQVMSRAIRYAVERGHLIAAIRQQSRDLAAMEERQILARDLQDTVVQSLFAASTTAEALVRLCNGCDYQDVITELHGLIRDSLLKTQGMLLKLHSEIETQPDEFQVVR